MPLFRWFPRPVQAAPTTTPPAITDRPLAAQAPARPQFGPPRRRLFLDDDPMRAEIFLAEFPDAVWVQTVQDCLARLAESWDEVHLDHDLGGEHFVDHGRDDCGMEVVRWLCREPRPHLRLTRFHVHSHNAPAATLMGLQMLSCGFTVEVRPFGAPPEPAIEDEPDTRGWFRRLLDALLGRQPEPDLGYGEYREELPPAEAADEPRLDLTWVRATPRTARNAARGPAPERPDFSWVHPDASQRPASPPLPPAKPGPSA